MQRFCLTLDLIDDPDSIKEYEEYHAAGNAWPEVTQHDIDCGVTNIEIFRTGNRMFMILETVDDFTFEEKAKKDADNPIIQKWENLMWKYQQPIPWAKPGEKWVLMKRIFKSGE
ncbi:L-rhamnose mutarotase [Algoriphagus sp. SE2]|uniref:L-rhamnose mutarotase n=1 Tax=Algoriphagus sp. SE2 TaxID=3141536 RepID=UPI0031CD33DC